ncbi:MAG: amino acid permease [Planctomycetes bacterium]|nr:amino acid permease [Planctomycetota bacterium]
MIRALGPLMATAIVIGTVIGSGIFKKPQTVAFNVPYFGLAALVWVGGGVLVMLGALAYAEVAALLPRAGGNFVFLREGYGRMAGFLWGWVEFFIIKSGSIAALATLFTLQFRRLLLLSAPGLGEQLGYWQQRILTVVVILLLAAVNIRGVKWSGGLQLVITLVKVGSLLFIIALPFLAFLWVSGSGTRAANPARLEPSWPDREQLTFNLLGGFASALLAAQWAYHGWQNLAPVAEEVKEPQRNIPRSLLTGTAIVVALYLGANLAYSLVLTQDEMKGMKEDAALQQAAEAEGRPHDDTVAIGFCREVLGPFGVALAAAAVMCSVFGALNGVLLVTPRLLYAMGEDGMAPRALGAIHPRYRTPALAILVLAVWACLLVLGVAALTELDVLAAGKDHFNILTDFAMFGAVIFETMAVLSIFIFRRTMPDAPRPYRCWGYPVVPALYVILPGMILVNMFFREQQEALTGVGFIALGAAVYWLYGRRRADLRR